MADVLSGINLNCFPPPALLYLRWGSPIMESVEHYQTRAEECARQANATDNEELRNELLCQMKIYLGVVVRLRNYAIGKGFSVASG